jgi:hypothetical protein
MPTIDIKTVKGDKAEIEVESLDVTVSLFIFL